MCKLFLKNISTTQTIRTLLSAKIIKPIQYFQEYDSDIKLSCVKCI